MVLKNSGNSKTLKKTKCPYCKEKFELNEDSVDKIGGKSIYTCPHCYEEIIK